MSDPPMPDLPIACSLGDPERRQRRDGVLRSLFTRAQEIRPLTDGYTIRFPADGAVLVDLAQLIDLERQCCAFLTFRLTVEPGGGPVWLEHKGPSGTKEFLEAELQLAPRNFVRESRP